MERQMIKILFLGDEKVGKTSIIRSIAGEAGLSSFKLNSKDPSYSQAQPLCIQSSLKPDHYIILQDSPPIESGMEEIKKNIKNANIIILIYDLNELESIPRLS